MTEPPESDPDAQQLDVGDVELSSMRDVSQAGGGASAPPPLPAEVAQGGATPSYIPPPQYASIPAPPAKRPPIFYAALVAAFVLVGLVVGGVLSMTLRKPKESPVTPGPEKKRTVPPRPRALVDDYVRWAGGSSGAYGRTLPAHQRFRRASLARAAPALFRD